MMSNTGETPESVRRLLALQRDAEPWTPEELASMFLHQLRSNLTIDLPGEDDRKRMAIEELAAKSPPPIVTFADLFAAAAPPIHLLELVKRFAKGHRADSQSALPPEIATGLYFLAIVAARVRCNASITQLPEGELKAGVGWVVRQAWCDPASRQLLQGFLAG